jgi:DNA-directed RNA polymerase specialized sigma24 family protein
MHRFFKQSADAQDLILALALDRLAAEDDVLCETLLRTVYYEEAYAEIAKSMAVSKGTVSRRRHRAEKRLSELVQEELKALEKDDDDENEAVGEKGLVEA